MELKAGQRFLLTDTKKYWRLLEGSVEAYSIITDDRQFRQLFIASFKDAGAVFPLNGSYGIGTQIYAVSDTVWEEVDISNDLSDRELKDADIWFGKLFEESALCKNLYLGDSNISSFFERWKQIPDGKTKGSLVLEIMSYISDCINRHFSAENDRYNKQLEQSRNIQHKIVEEAIGTLLREDIVVHAQDGMGDDVQNDVAFIVRQAGRKLHLPETELTILPAVAAKLDLLGLLRRMTQKANISIRLISLEPDWNKKDSGVIIGYYGENKELSLLWPTEPGKYNILNKTFPQGTELTEEIIEQLEVNAFSCYAGLPNKKLTIKDIGKFILENCWQVDIWTIVFASFVSGIVALILPIMTETIFQDLIPINDFQGLTTVAQVAVAAAFTTAVVSAVKSVAMLRFTTHVSVSVEAAIITRLLSLPTKFFRRYQSGELAKRLVGVNSIQELLGGQTIPAIFSFFFTFWSLLLMLYYDVATTILACLLWLIYIIIMFGIYRNVVQYQRELVEAGNKTAATVQQIFTGLAKFRLRGTENQAYNIWSKLFIAEWKNNLKLRWQANIASVLQNIQPLLMTILLFLITVAKIKASAHLEDPELMFNGAQFMAFFTAFTGFNAGINEVIPIASSLFLVKPHIENIIPILEETPEIKDEKIDSDALTGEMEVSHLCFSYTPGGKEILHDISFHISAGEHVAIVGTSGCGKSTLIRLLLGFEEPNSGAVYYDNQDLSALNLSSVRCQMGVVLQNGQLMSGDIFSNIVGAMAFTQEDAWAAAEAAGIADDIREMPMGMQTVISEGSTNISGGQRQRILIARALVAKPSILVFDEATSALDNRTQAIVTESLNKLNVTRIVVAHRLSTIRNADKIIVLDKGQIAEMGTFDELLANNGLFATLVNRQSV